MLVHELGVDGVAARLRSDGLGIDLGAAAVCIRSDIDELPSLLSRLYGDFEVAAAPGLFDVTVQLKVERAWWRRLRPQVNLWLDGEREFEPFPRDTPLPLLEWGINYGLASRLSCYLLLHAGVVARGDKALVLPAMPGSGKSTLTAYLSRRGYRLLSDEFGVIRLDDGLVLPLLRPVALKNASIDVLRAADPALILGPSYPRTRKGTVAHMAPSASDARAVHQPARPAAIVFPQYVPGAGAELQPLEPARAFGRLAVNSFNYDVLGPQGFEVLCDVIETTSAHALVYGDLAAAVSHIDALMGPPTGGESTR